MSFLCHLKGFLGSKVAALAAGALLIGGGIAVAAPDTTVLETRPAAVSEADEPETDDGLLADADVQQEADTGESELESMEESEEESDEESDAAENTEELRTEADATAETGEDDGERSAVARAVHEALTGGLDLEPGDPGFGAAVSNNARNGGNGHAASSAARGANGSAGRDAPSPDTDGSGDRDPRARGQRDGAPFGEGPEGTGPPGHAAPPGPAGP
jgi:hypothetical protein